MTNSHNAVLLIDFDNYFKKDINEYNEKEIEYHLIRIIEEVLKKKPNVEKTTLRLYGGWYEDEHLSKKASIAMQLFSEISLFPIRLKSQKRLIHGEIEFATELLQIPGYKWYHTYKERAGISHIRINKENIDAVCEKSKDLCPIFIISIFTKSKNKFCKVPGCTNIQKDVFFSREQKMVDTLIACDIISLFEDSNIDSIFLISEDMDHLPVLAFGCVKTNKTKKVFLCISNENVLPIFNSIISNFDIEIILLS